MLKKIYEQFYMSFIEERTKDLLEKFNVTLNKICEDSCFYTDPENLADIENPDVFVALHLDYCDPIISDKVTHILKKYGWIEVPSIKQPQYSYLALTNTDDVDGKLQMSIKALSKLASEEDKQLSLNNSWKESTKYDDMFSRIYEELYTRNSNYIKSAKNLNNCYKNKLHTRES